MKKNRMIDFFHFFSQKRLTTVAGAWVFFFLTSVLPLAFLMVTAFGVFGVDLSLELVARLPIEYREAGEAIVSTAEKASSGATVIFLFTVIFSGSTLLNQMSKDGDHIYGKKSNSKRGLFRRAWAILGLACLFSIFLAVAFLVAFGSNLINKASVFNKNPILSMTLTLLVIITFCYFLIIILNRFISPVKLKFFHLAIGALISLFIIVLGTIGFTLYLRFFNSYNAFYGSLAGIIVFLLWVYILMIGLVIGVIINSHNFNSVYKL
ncbi:MAG: YihY/virulence factor BrkB family protein [Clostridiales bacterium]|nr:YihY/virulence factor BrkB family protein [Clostridiales bacterium]